jgi:hypothetical protein
VTTTFEKAHETLTRGQGISHVIHESEHPDEAGGYRELRNPQDTSQTATVACKRLVGSELDNLPEDPYAMVRRELAVALTDDHCEPDDHAAKARLYIAQELAQAASDIEEAAYEAAFELRKKALRTMEGN